MRTGLLEHPINLATILRNNHTVFNSMPPQSPQIQKTQIFTIKISVVDSDKVHPGLKKIQNSICNINHTWKFVMTK